MPNLLQRPPTPRNSCPLCLPRRGYPCHTCIGSLLHSLSACREWPSTGPLPVFSSRLPSFSPDREFEATVEPEHWQGNVEWSCGGSQCLGSSGCLEVPEEHRQRENEWAHHPTDLISRGHKSKWLDLPFPAKTPHSCPSSRRSHCTPCYETNLVSQSRSCSRNGTCCSFHPPSFQGQRP